ncbi:protein NRT1/ PTR FAMILY 5.5-like [Rutidosis leptorrhynchoides]|uniref:protein NRT1/ PTR FAMILY 5.5-like n=1 Tax=Rutidosis leptorrhynchoides TaxID=125765 RepID=UPI003A9A1D2B
MANFLDALCSLVERLAVLMLIKYVTDVWETGITYAAGLINIWVGTTKVLPLVFLFLLDNYISSYWMLIFSTTASALGMGLMSISTPSWLYRLITGSCSEYKMKSVSEMQQSFFYLALVLIMIGRSSRDAIMETMNYKGDANEQKSTREIVTRGGDYIALQVSVLLVAPWSIIFGVSSVYSSVALFLLMGKSWSHKLYIDKPVTSQVTTILRVFVASISNISQKLPYDSVGFYQKIKIDDSPLHCSSTLRFLEKAAIRPPVDYERQNRWRLCSIQEVENTKTIVRMLWMGVVFVILFPLSSVGSNYFIEQAKYLKPTFLFLGFVDASLERVIHLFLAEDTSLAMENFKMFMVEAVGQ